MKSFHYKISLKRPSEQNKQTENSQPDILLNLGIG
jgi:hypothetical protein